MHEHVERQIEPAAPAIQRDVDRPAAAPTTEPSRVPARQTRSIDARCASAQVSAPPMAQVGGGSPARVQRSPLAGMAPVYRIPSGDRMIRRDPGQAAPVDPAPKGRFMDQLGGERSLASLAAALKAYGPVSSGNITDAELLDLLTTTFEQNWFKAKATLTADQWPGVQPDQAPVHANSISLMAAMVAMRGRVWDAFVKQVQPKILAEVDRLKKTKEGFQGAKNPEVLGDNFGLKESVGSESVTSDIDLSAKGENTEIGLAMINREFRPHFGVSVEPGALFDINVYSSDWMFGGTEVRGDRGVYTLTPREEGSLQAKARQKKNDQNEVWSMVKTRRNMNDFDWRLYKTTMLAGLHGDDQAAQTKEMNKKFDTADAEYTTFRNDVRRRVAEMTRAVDHEEQRQKSAYATGGHDHYADEADEMEVSNRRYEEIVLLVKALRLKIDKLSNDRELNADAIETLLLELHNEIARGLTYANEVYATQGAVLHTVYGKQGASKKLGELQAEHEKDPSKGNTSSGDAVTKVKYVLTKEMYLQSVNENVGDTLHSLNHNAHDPQYAVYRAGKYIDRLCEAVTELIGADGARKIPSYQSLETIGVWAVKEKKGKAGQDPMAVHDKTSFFSKFKSADHLGVVRSDATSLGARAIAEYKSTKGTEPT